MSTLMRFLLPSVFLPFLLFSILLHASKSNYQSSPQVGIDTLSIEYEKGSATRICARPWLGLIVDKDLNPAALCSRTYYKRSRKVLSSFEELASSPIYYLLDSQDWRKESHSERRKRLDQRDRVR